jgi:hypothetical protein
MVLAFARLVARPGGRALLINENNTSEGWISIEQAVTSGRCFAVVVAEDILAGDCDKPKLRPEVLRLADELRIAGQLPVLVNSGQASHLHLLCRISDADLLDSYRARARDMGLDVRRTIRPPLAPHRLRLASSLLEPRDVQKALAALSQRMPRTRRLSPRMAQALREGTPKGSRSNLIYALALAFCNAGRTLDEYIEAMLDPGNAAGEKLRARGQGRAVKYLTHTWHKAWARVAACPPVQSRAETEHLLAEIDAAANAARWRGVGGATRLAVLRAHLQAAKVGGLEYGASVRWLAEHAGVRLAAAVNANRALMRTGWLRCVFLVSVDDEYASTWRIGFPHGVRNQVEQPPSSPPQGGRNVRVGYTSLSADVWRWRRGLGKSAALVYALLDPEVESRVRELADQRQVKGPAVRKQLRKLERHGLAVRGKGGWRRGHEPLEEAARRLGVAGEGVRQREYHEEERRLRAHARHLLNGRISSRGRRVGEG